MKIAYIAFSEEFGGKTAGFVHASEMCEALISLGHQVTLYIKSGRDKRPDELENIEVRFLEKGLKNLINNYSKLKNELKQFDIIHERYSVNPYICMVQAGLGKPYVLEVNDPGAETWTGLKKWIYTIPIKIKFNFADAIITQTETQKNIIEKQTNTPVYVVSNGVDVLKFDVFETLIEKERQIIAPNDEKIICFMSSFREWHGVLEIPEIAENVIKKNPNVKFLIIGSGNEMKKFKEIIKEKNLERYFILKGEVDRDKIPVLLKASDICIAPFSTKKFPQLEKNGFWWCPVKLYEYMAAGKPIVSVDFEEVKKIVGNAGLLAEPNNLKQFSEFIIKLLSDENMRKTYGAAGIEIAENNTWIKKAKETLEVYSKNR
ncbi:MAG: glycosyltransferase family 4 protein [Candidatus Diapherotrites archaeon]